MTCTGNLCHIAEIASEAVVMLSDVRLFGHGLEASLLKESLLLLHSLCAFVVFCLPRDINRYNMLIICYMMYTIAVVAPDVIS